MTCIESGNRDPKQAVIMIAVIKVSMVTFLDADSGKSHMYPTVASAPLENDVDQPYHDQSLIHNPGC